MANHDTSTTLLRRLGQDPTNQDAWEVFVDRYGLLVFGWCRRWGLQEADAEDVTQNVLLELAKQMHRFAYDPKGSFRAWLRTIAYRSWCRFVADRQDAPNAADLDRLRVPAAGDDFLRQLERESDRELLDLAMGLVRLRVEPRTWEVFLMTAVEEQSGAMVAERLNMKVGTVFVARSKVQKMLRDEIRRLGGEVP